MTNPPDAQASEGDMDHGFGAVDALFVVAHEAAPSSHPTEGALDNPAARQHLEAWLSVAALDDLDDEVAQGGLVHQLGPIIGTIGEQVLEPGPALSHPVQDHLRARAVGDV